MSTRTYWVQFENDEPVMEAEVIKRLWFELDDGEPVYCYDVNTWHVDVGQVHTETLYSLKDVEDILRRSGYFEYSV